MAVDMTREIGQLWLHVQGASVSVLAAAVATLGVVIMMELRSVLRLRHVMDNNLSRVFEQLDLLRFETQQLLEGQQAMQERGPDIPVVSQVAAASLKVSTAPYGSAQSVQPATPAAAAASTAPARPVVATVASVAVVPAPPGAVYQNAAALAAGGASSSEIAQRFGLATGEARLLSSLAQARARRAQAASA